MLDRQIAAPEMETTVVCRPAASFRAALWFVILLQASLALVIFMAGMISLGAFWSSLGIGILGSIFFTPFSLWAAAYLSRACVIADEEGLRWRYTRRWRRASWAEVVSYSEDWLLPSRQGASQQTKPSLKIRTLKGTILVSPGNWTSTTELREIIQRNATAANQSGWLVTGGATTYLPLKCRYDTTVNRNILGWMATIHKYGLLVVAVYFALQWFMTHTLPGWGWLLTPTGLFVIAKQILPFLLRPTYCATQPRLDDKVFADKDGLRFISGGSETDIAWADITDLYSLGIRSVVVTRDGGEHDFLDTLTDVERLKLVIPRLAVNAGYRGWRTGTVRRQEITAEDGRSSAECVYRYRSQNNFAALFGLTLAALFLAAVAAGPALIAWQSGMSPGSRELGIAACGLVGLLAMIWLWGNYWRGATRTNEEGITQQGVFGRRFLPWGQVRAFHWRGGLDLVWGCVEGMSGTLTFWKGLGDTDRLVEEIAAHGVVTR